MRLAILDVPANTKHSEIELVPNEHFPEGSRILSVHSLPEKNCAVAIVTHPSFRETAFFEHLEGYSVTVVMFHEGA